MKKLIPTVALALMGAAAVSGSTYAWFSMNKSVEAKGMKVQATTAGALVIGNSLSTITKQYVNFADATGSHVLSHSTHDDAITYVEGDAIPEGYEVGDKYSTSLKTISVNDGVDSNTGYLDGDAHYSEALNGTDDGSTQYFVDYHFYIASAGEAMNGTIKMEMTDEMKANIEHYWGINMSKTTKDTVDTVFGFTADVYCSGVINSAMDEEEDADDLALNFKESFHFDDVNHSYNLYTGDIPSNKTTVEVEEEDVEVGQGLHVMLRIYLDGDYAKKAGTMTECASDAKCDGVSKYFTLDSTTQDYTEVTGLKYGDDVQGKYMVGTPGAAQSSKYVKTYKASTAELDVGFKFSA